MITKLIKSFVTDLIFCYTITNRLYIIYSFKIFRDGVSPAETAASLPASPAASTLAKKKAGGANDVRERAAAVRTRRLMKELKEIQRSQDHRPDPVFTVRKNLFTPCVCVDPIIFLSNCNYPKKL